MRKFGIEIEFAGNLQSVLNALQAAGLQVQDSRHTHNTGIAPSAWCVKRDGSVPNGGELVSPPLDFDNPEERGQVTTAVLALQAAGATTDPNAGIHVHVEARNADGSIFTGKQVAAVVRFFYKFEDAIYRIASSGWQRLRPDAGSFCKPIPEETAKKIMKVRDLDQLRRVWDGPSNPWQDAHDRYFAVNLRSFFYRNTIEFRVFNSSINPVRIQTYIALCVAIVEDARKGYSRSVKKSYRLGSMFSGEVTEEALMLRFQQVLRYESGISEEDWKNLRKICWKGSVPQPNVFAHTNY